VASVVVDRTGGDVELRAAKASTWHDTVTVYDTDGVTPLNMTGYSFQMQVRADRAEDATLIASSGAATVTLGVGSIASGIVTWSVASTVTDDVTEGRVHGELWWQTAAGVREPLLTYSIVVEPRITVWA
jgi:hypothetical protein